jgi:hypothetical protein
MAQEAHNQPFGIICAMLVHNHRYLNEEAVIVMKGSTVPTSATVDAISPPVTHRVTRAWFFTHHSTSTSWSYDPYRQRQLNRLAEILPGCDPAKCANLT